MSSMSSNQNVLYTPTECGALKLKNRIVYPAMTRARCPGRTVNSEMVKYYTARSSAGMIVTEPSAVCEGANGYSDAPGMYTEEHATAWAEVTKALHANSCTVVAQLWHTGRMSHSSFLGGKQVVSASALPIVPRPVERSARPAWVQRPVRIPGLARAGLGSGAPPAPAGSGGSFVVVVVTSSA